MHDFQAKADKHLAAMLDTGGHHSVFLVTPATRIIPFTRFIRRFILERLGHPVAYHLFWFTTPEGYVVSISSDITVRHIIEALYERAVIRGYITSAEKLYVGRSAKALTATVSQMVKQYKPTTTRQQHSFGGSALTGVNE